MQTNLLKQSQKYSSLFFRIFGLLLFLQAARAALSFALGRGFGLPQGLHADSPALIGIDLVAFATMVVLLFLLARPSGDELALSLRAIPKGGRIFTALIGLLFVILLGISFVAFPDQILNNVRASLVVPLVEELIFRGVLWNAIRKPIGAGRKPVSEGLVYGIVTITFAVWHLGYADSVMRTAPADLGIGHILLMKLVIGGIVGALAGLARWKARNIYAAIIVHGLWNLFGR